MNKEFSKEDIIELADKKISEGHVVKAIVGFIDLLGFSAELTENWDNNANDFLHRIMRIKAYSELAKINGDPHEFKDYDHITIIDTSEYPKQIKFSDSFIFIKEVDESSNQTIITSVLSLFATIVELWSYAIEEGFTLRGAVDFGEFYYTPNDIIGPAFISAYRMESKIAKTSRIIFSQEVANLINENIDKSHSRFKDYCQLWFKKDIDGLLILNPCIAFGLKNHDELDLAKQRVEKMKFKANDHDAKAKYIDLIERLNDRSIEYSDMDIFKKKL